MSNTTIITEEEISVLIDNSNESTIIEYDSTTILQE